MLELNKETTLCNIRKQQIRNAALTWMAVILILGLVAIGSYAGISLYQTYTSSKNMEKALEYAKDNCSMVQIRASNGGSCAFNVKAGNAQAALRTMQGSAYSIILYPRNYRKEYFQVYPNAPIMEPYTVSGELLAS